MNGSVITITRLAAVAASLVALSGCEVQKSSNPLSPSVAGPIPGVSITTPVPVAPVAGAVVTTAEPLRLVFNNASSSGVRPFWYVVEVAADVAFSTKVYTNSKVAPSDQPQTSVVVGETLQADRAYYWRVKADDGANASEFSGPASFRVEEPVTVDPPVPFSPVGGQTTSSNRPELIVTNGRVSGNPARVEYRFEVATDPGFGGIVARLSAERSSAGRTTVQAPALPAGSLLYWRAIGTSGTVTSPPSAVESFRTPTDGGGGGGGGGGGYVPPPPPSGGGRTPDPPPGARLPLPDMFWLVQQVAAQYPNALRNSCQDHGGTWEFMDRVVDELRRYDTRWGYNWKRGNVGDPSKDVVDYHWGRGPDEGSTEVYIIDVIAGHCGPNPGPGWFDVTDSTYNSGTVGRWTGRGRF